MDALTYRRRLPDEGQVRNCVMHSFSDHFIRFGLRWTTALGYVTLSARKVGTVKILQRTEKVHDTAQRRIHHDIPLIQFAKA